MLKALRIKNFKAVAEQTVHFLPVCLLIGANGSGKTTVLQAIDLLGWLVSHSLDTFLSEHNWSYADLPNIHTRHADVEVAVELELDGRALTWEIALGSGKKKGIAWERISDASSGEPLLNRSGREVIRFNEQTRVSASLSSISLPSSFLSTLDLDEDQSQFPGLVAVARWARAIRGYFFLNPVVLRSANRGMKEEIGTHGEWLAPFLASLKKQNPAGFHRLVERVQRHYPRLVSLLTRQTRFGWTYIEVVERWNSKEARFNAHQVGDGLLRLIAVAAMLELGTSPSVILLDEIENGLHPHLLGGLLGMLREFTQQSGGNLQVVATTHSPIAVNYCEPAEVVLVARNAGGTAEVKRLDEAAKVAELSAHFELGELWYNLGDEKLKL